MREQINSPLAGIGVADVEFPGNLLSVVLASNFFEPRD
jgi:hypothetical protein